MSVAVPACYTPGYNSYATPKVTPAGKIAAGFHVQVSGYSGEIENQKHQNYWAPTPPGVSGRLGLGGRWDAGVRLGTGLGLVGASALNLGGDLKWLAIPGEALDIALNPALRFTSLSGEVAQPDGSLTYEGVNHWEVEAPVLAGINLDQALVVVVSPGVVFGWYSEPAVPLAYSTYGRLVSGVAPRVGVGLNVRASDGLAIHPEATFVYTTQELNRHVIYTFGLAIQVGRLPPALRASEPTKPRESAE